MEQAKKKLEQFVTWLKRPRTKKRMYALIVVLVALWVVYRFAMVAAMNRTFVYNPVRAALENGTVVEVLNVTRQNGVIREPVTIKNNRAYVSGARAALLRAGQKIGDGEIVSVASGIDLDTGMHAVRTRGVADGLQYAEFRANGYFVPVYAVNNATVFVADGDIARARTVRVARQDSETAYITDGLRDGDVVILTRVADGDKIQIKK